VEDDALESKLTYAFRLNESIDGLCEVNKRLKVLHLVPFVIDVDVLMITVDEL